MKSVAVLAAVAGGALLTLISGGAAIADTISTAPSPDGVAMSSEYTVKANGQMLAVYSAPVWYPSYVKPFGGPYAFATFDFSGTVKIEIATDKPLNNVVVRPESRGIRPTVRGKTLAFSLHEPCLLSIELDGKNGPLLLFANPLEQNRPDPSNAKVKYFGPGIHKVGKIELKDDETLYIAAGAVVQAGVRACGKNIRIAGRGILDGSPWNHPKRPTESLLQLHRCSDVLVEGIVLKDSWGWTLMSTGSRNVTIRNIKICSARCEGNDGMDIVNSCNVSISNCFIRTDDDCIAPKGMGERLGREPYPPVEDLIVEHCVLWTDRAHVWRIGCECRAAAMRRLTFRDIDVLHYTDPTCPAISVQPAENMLIEDVRFENIRIHHEGQAKFLELAPYPTIWAKTQASGMIRNLVFKDITLDGQADGKRGAIVIRGADPHHPINNVVFQNVTRHGERVRSDSAEISVSGEAKQIEFR